MTSLSSSAFSSADLLATLPPADAPVVVPSRPAQVLYAGAHLWKSTTLQRAGELARSTFVEATPDAASFSEVFALPLELATEVRTRVEAKLAVAPIDDYRVDFEDGYGVRSDEDEDAAAEASAHVLAALVGTGAGALPPFFGIRVRALSPATRARSLRTLDRFFASLRAGADAGVDATELLPTRFVVTLPKVESPAEVAVLARALAGHERALGLSEGRIGLEIMVETPRALVSPSGSWALRALVDAGGGRVVAAHFGAYDYLSSLGIAGADQGLDHPSCVLARSMMKLSLADVPVGLSDGATIALPLPLHRASERPLSAEQHLANQVAVRQALSLHATNVTRALREGFRQGWDLHPAQLVARWAAVFAFYARERRASVARLRGFLERAARATALGGVFDDAASALGLVTFFVDGVAAGALDRGDVEAALGISVETLATRDFSRITAARGPG